MPRIVVLCLLAAALALAGGSSSSHASTRDKPPAVPGELIVGFDAGVDQADQAAIAAKAGGKLKHEFKQIRAAVVTVDGDAKGAAKKLERDHRVRYAEANYLVSTTATPNDPQYSKLYGLNNTGQTGGNADADIDAPEAWNVTTGSPNVTVAVIDTGVDFSHPDLSPQQWVNAGENCGSTDPRSRARRGRTESTTTRTATSTTFAAGTSRTATTTPSTTTRTERTCRGRSAPSATTASASSA